MNPIIGDGVVFFLANAGSFLASGVKKPEQRLYPLIRQHF
jgi:hypothetical protein